MKMMIKKTIGVLLVVLLVVFGLAKAGYLQEAGTFLQDSWNSGTSSTVAVHPGNQSNWSRYTSRDSNILTAGGSIYLAPNTFTVTDTSDTDFAKGTLNNVIISGTGNGSQLELTSSVTDPFASQLGEWLNLPSIPAPGLFSTYTKMGNYIYCLFGSGDGKQFGRFNLTSKTWEFLTPIPVAVAVGATITNDGEYIYALRGSGSRDAYFYLPPEGPDPDPANTLFSVASPAPGEWKQFPSLTSGVNYGSNIVRTGGTLSSKSGALYAMCGSGSTTFVKYDPNIGGGVWMGRSSTPATIGEGGALAYKPGSNFIYAARGSQTDTFWRYNISANTWDTSLAAVPDLDPSNTTTNINVRFWQGSDLWYPGSGDYVYAAGMYDEYDSSTVYRRQNRSFFKYGPLSGAATWTRLPDVPSYLGAYKFIIYDPDAGGPTEGDELQYFSGKNYTRPWRFDNVNEKWITLSQAPYDAPYGINICYPGTGDFLYYIPADGNYDFYRYSISGNSWERLKNLPSGPRYAGTRLCYLNGYIYCLKGYTSGSFYRYAIAQTPGADNWDYLANYPYTDLEYGSSIIGVQIAGQDYIYGLRGNEYGNFYRYNVSTDTWADTMATMPDQPDGSYLIFPNYAEPNGYKYIYAARGQYSNDMYKYGPIEEDENLTDDIDGDFQTKGRWTQVTDTPSYFRFCENYGACLSYQGSGPYIYAFTGDNDDIGYAFRFARYNMDTDAWDDLDSTPMNQTYFDCTSTSDAIFAVGYYGYGNFWKYDLATQQWNEPVIDQYRNELGTTVVDSNNNIYLVYGGRDGYHYSHFWKFDPNQNRWTDIIRAPFVLAAGVKAEYLTSTNSIYVTEGRGSTTLYKYNVGTKVWSECAESPIRFWRGAQLAADDANNIIYAMPGWDIRNFYVYDAADYWNQLENPPKAHEDMIEGMEVANGKVYLLSGDDEAEFYEYSPLPTNTWLPKTKVGDPTGDGSVFETTSHGGGLFYPGSGDLMYCITRSSNKVLFTYSLSTDRWNQLAELPIDPYDRPTSIVAAGKPWFFIFNYRWDDYLMRYHVAENIYDLPSFLPAEINEDCALAGYKGYIYYLNRDTFYRYNAQLNLWSELLAPPITFDETDTTMRIVEFEGQPYAYVTGGNNRNGFYRYSITSNTWQELPSPPANFEVGTSMTQKGNYLYILRGESNAFWEYNLVNNTWALATDTPQYVYYGGQVVYPGSGDYVYVMTGNHTANLYRYNTVAKNWTARTPAPVPMHNAHSELIYPGFGDYLFVLQGASYNTDQGSYVFMRYKMSDPGGDTWEELTPSSFAVRHPGTLIWGDGEYFYGIEGRGNKLARYYSYCFGDYTSGVKEIGNHSGWGDVSWIFNSVQSAAIAFRSGDTLDLSDADVWSNVADVTNGQDLSNSAACANTDKYIQYKITFSTDELAESPAIEQMQFEWEKYPISQTLTSSIYDTTFLTNRILDLSWQETLPLGTDARFQMRTSADNNTWSSWMGIAAAQVLTNDLSDEDDYARSSKIQIASGIAKLFKELADFKYMQTITVDNLGGPLETNKLVNVVIPKTNTHFWNNVRDDGYDVRFYDGTQKYEYKLIDFDRANKTGAFLVQIPSLPADDELSIYMLYDSPSADTESNEALRIDVRESDLAARWNFDQTIGNTVPDSSGNNNNGYFMSSPLWTTEGKFGGALSCDGLDDYVTVPSTSSLQLTGDMTLGIWVYPENVGTNWYMQTIHKRYWGEFSFGIYRAGSLGYLQGYGTSSYNSWSLSNYNKVQNNKWHHLVVVRDGTTKQITSYINGVQQRSYNYASGYQPVTSYDPVMIMRGYTGYEIKGKVDHTTIHNVPLTAAEVEQLYLGYDLSNPEDLSINESSATCVNLAGWLYKVPITVTNNSASIVNNSIITINAEQWHEFWQHVNSDGSDVRAVDSDDTTLLTYYLQEFDSAAKTGRINVEIPTIPASSSKTIYLYYGNSGASNIGNSSLNLEWDVGTYPDFSGWSRPSTWNTNTGIYMMGGYARLGLSADTQKTVINLPAGTYEIEFNYYYIDSWDSEYGQLYWNGTRIWNVSSSTIPSGPDVGGYSTYGDRVDHPAFKVTVVHPGGNAVLRFASTTNESTVNESFGVNNIIIRTLQSSTLEVTPPYVTENNIYDTGTYYTDNPVVQPILGVFYEGNISNFQAVTTEPSNTDIGFQVSADGYNWYWYSTGDWRKTELGYLNTNSAAQINSNLVNFQSKFPAGDFYYRAFLNSSGTNTPELNEVRITLTSPPSYYFDAAAGEAVNTINEDCLDDRYIQYRTTLYSYGESTPVIDSVSIDYIKSEVNVTSPNGGEEWPVASAQTITWTSAGVDDAASHVKIEYSSNNGTSWNTIIGSTANDGSYPWTVENSASPNCLVRITSVEFPTVIDQSDAVFQIMGLILTAPNGGQVWEVNRIHTITWTSSGTVSNELTIEYSTNNGTSWAGTLATQRPNTGTTNCQMPNVNSDAVRIRIFDSLNTNVIDVSDAVMSIVPAPVITINTPNGAEQWIVGDTYTIDWQTNSRQFSANVILEYSKDNFSTTVPIITKSIGTAAGPNNNDDISGSHDWVVPEDISTTVKIRIREESIPPARDTQSIIWDMSDNNFSLIFPYITISSPQEEVTWVSGDAHDITWTFFGTVSNDLLLEYTTDGSNFTTIDDNQANDGLYSWTVPDEDSATVQVRITDNAWNQVTGISPVFTIIPYPVLKVLYPNGGEVLAIGATYELRWTSFGQKLASGGADYFNIDIWYSANNGTTWAVVSLGQANDGSLNWQTADAETTEALVKVEDSNDLLIVDTSDAVFEITNPVLTITSPNGAEGWYATGTYDITWDSLGAVSNNLLLEYSTNAGVSWTTIAGSQNNDHVYSWTVADVISDQVKIKITDSNRPLVWDDSDANFSILAPTITVTVPNGGEEWIIGTSHGIEWATQGGDVNAVKDNLTIQYSSNGGGSWNDLWTGLANSGSQAWEIPDDLSDNCLIRIFDAFRPATIDQSDAMFAIKIPYVDIIAPNGGESWPIGTTQSINWGSLGTVSNNLVIEYSKDNFVSNINTISTFEANDGLYEWLSVADDYSVTVKIRITDADNPSITDTSETAFTIAYPLITVTVPNGGEIWTVGDTENITWTNTGSVGNDLKIEYSKDNFNADTNMIIVSTANTGSYSWPSIPNDVSASVRVRITDNTRPVVWDRSNGNFTILPIPAITITAPNGGEIWRYGTTQSITWEDNGGLISNNLTITYSTDNGTTYTGSIITGAANIGSYSWNIPDDVHPQCFLRIQDAQRPSTNDISDASFIIADPRITITSPNGGEVWAVADQAPITWTTEGTISNNLILQYSGNGGSSYTQVASGISNTGAYTWTVPDDVTTNALFEITDGNRPVSKDISNAVFRIIAMPLIDITTPDGGEEFVLGDTSSITWTWLGLSISNNLLIDYSGDGFATRRVIASVEANDGLYTWAIPDDALTGSTLKMRITDGNRTEITNQSGGYFRIRGGFTILSPNGGENWVAKSDHSVTWQTKGTISRVKLEYSTDNGLNWSMVASNVSNAGAYTWILPDAQSVQARIRISDVDDPTVNDQNDATFNIVYASVVFNVLDYDTLQHLQDINTNEPYTGWNDSGVNSPISRMQQYPYGNYTTFFSKTNYIDNSVSWVAPKSGTDTYVINTYLENSASAQVTWEAVLTYSFSPATDSLSGVGSLQRKGKLVGTNELERVDMGPAVLTIYEPNSTVIRNLVSANAPGDNGMYNLMLTNTDFESGQVYPATLTITYRSREYTSSASIDVGSEILQYEFFTQTATQLAASVAQIETAVGAGTQATINKLDETRASLENKVDSSAATVIGVVTDTKTELTANLSSTRESLEGTLAATSEDLQTTMKSNILNREKSVKGGADLMIRYRTYSGLIPKIDVYDTQNVQRIDKGLMTEMGTTGIYEYKVKFYNSWGQGDCTIVCSEETKGTLDALTITIVRSTVDDIAGQTSAILGSTSGLSDIGQVVDILGNQIGLIEASFSRIGKEIVSEAQGGSKRDKELEVIYNQLSSMGAQLKDLGQLESVGLGGKAGVAEEKKKDIVYLKNKTQEMKAMLELNNKMIENISAKPVTQVWYEFK
ncbi:MAG: DUF2341 domain-containing protein [Candidatus Omnitrophota bacterium]